MGETHERAESGSDNTRDRAEPGMASRKHPCAGTEAALLALIRATRFPDGKARCPHCGCARVHRWGGFSGRRRYRCTACQRTFSDLTGTALGNLKRIERWFFFAVAMREGLSVRAGARMAGVHRETSFRWRHRLLGELQRREEIRLDREVAMVEAYFRRSFKGCRRLTGRTARRRGREGVGTWMRERACVMLLRDGAGALASAGPRITPGPPAEKAIFELLGPLIRPGAVVIVPRAARLSPIRILERRMEATVRALGWIDIRGAMGHLGSDGRAPRENPDVDPSGSSARDADARTPAPDGAGRRDAPREAQLLEELRRYRTRMRRWLRRFRGVATRYLANYLRWHRWVDGISAGEGGSGPEGPVDEEVFRLMAVLCAPRT
jgi:transposase-like protein